MNTLPYSSVFFLYFHNLTVPIGVFLEHILQEYSDWLHFDGFFDKVLKMKFLSIKNISTGKVE